jgi:hypothetical protein
MPFLAPLIPAVVGGLASSAAGAGVNALLKGASGGSAANPNLQTPVNSAQTTQQIQQSQQALQQQQALANQLQAQGGIGNQSNVYAQQQALAGQLGQLAAGQGPNPALNQLQQTTGQNVANQAALMAGQRGAGANAGLIARQAAQQGAATQQQAAGQAATLSAQQQLAYTNALQQQQQNLANLATQQVGQQMGATQANTAANQAQQQALLGQVNAQNQAQLGASGQQNQANQYQQTAGQGLAQGIGGGLGTAITSMMTPQAPMQTSFNNSNSENAALGQLVQGLAQGGQVQQGGPEVARKENYKGKSQIGARLMAKGGKVDAIVSPGEIYLTKEKAQKVAEGKMSPMKGERIPGKAKVAGDSLKNDTVHKKLEVGGVVVKRTAAQDEESAKKFVEAVKSKKSKK